MTKVFKNVGWKFNDERRPVICDKSETKLLLWFESGYGVKADHDIKKLAKLAIKRKKSGKEDPIIMLTGPEKEDKSYPYYESYGLYDFLIQSGVLVEQDPIINV